MSGLDGGRALDAAIAALRALTASECGGCEGECWAPQYVEHVDQVAAEVAEFRAIEKASERELARLRRIEHAARAVAVQWERMLRCYSSNMHSVVLAELLDELAAEVLGGRSGE